MDALIRPEKNKLLGEYTMTNRTQTVALEIEQADEGGSETAKLRQLGIATIGAVIILIAAFNAAAAQTAQRIGDTIFFDDGTTALQIGSSTYCN